MNQGAVMHFSANPASEANKCEGELIPPQRMVMKKSANHASEL